MKFKRYCWKIVKHNVKKKLLGYRLKLFFKSEYNHKLILIGKITELKDIRTEKIEDKKLMRKKTLGIFRQYCYTYTNEFMKEMFNKNKKLIAMKETEIVGFTQKS